MRVTFVSMYTARHEKAEVTKRLRRTAELLAGRDHEMTVLCAEWWDGEVVEFKQDGVTYHRVTGASAVGGFASHAPFALHEISPDMIQVTSYPSWHVTAVGAAARLLQTPVVAD